jgi:hypothetical protein
MMPQGGTCSEAAPGAVSNSWHSCFMSSAGAAVCRRLPPGGRSSGATLKRARRSARPRGCTSMGSWRPLCWRPHSQVCRYLSGSMNRISTKPRSSVQLAAPDRDAVRQGCSLQCVTCIANGHDAHHTCLSSFAAPCWQAWLHASTYLFIWVSCSDQGAISRGIQPAGHLQLCRPLLTAARRCVYL